MPDDILWKFYGYVTPAGGRAVQEWWVALDDDARDTLLDTIQYLQVLPQSQWCKPAFASLGDGLSEVRAKANQSNRIYRIYGFFWPTGNRYVYTFVLGADKKVSNPKPDIAEGRKKRADVISRKASIHEFEFKGDIDSATQTRPKNTRGVR